MRIVLAALTNYSSGSYVLSAAIPGVWLAAWIAAKLDDGDTAKLLDAAAPGIALAVAFIRLSSLFNSSCRSKIPVTTGLPHLALILLVLFAPDLLGDPDNYTPANPLNTPPHIKPE